MTTPIEHYKQGLSLYGQHKNEEAAAEFRAALEGRPDWIDALHALATAQSKLGRQDEALATIARVIELDPTDPFAFTSQSIFLQRKGLIAEAEAASAFFCWPKRMSPAL